jgi:heme exporter protein B
MHAALAIFRKDLRIEWRTRESLSTLVVLSVLLVVSLAMAHDPTPAEAARLAPGILWATVIFTGVLVVQRSFLIEREHDCLATLVGAPIDPVAIYVGKALGMLVLLAAMQVVVVPLVSIMLRIPVWAVLPELAVVLGLGDLGFAGLATIFAAMTARMRVREMLLPILLLPLLTPVLIAGVKATEAVLEGGLPAAGEALGVLVAFDVIFLVAGGLLFPFVVRD